jgi:spermidine/putrescine transport system permease protein
MSVSAATPAARAHDAAGPPAKRTGMPSMRQIERRRRLLWLAPPVAWFTVFMLVPYAIMIYYSLGKMDYVTFAPGFSLENYIKVFTVDPYWRVIFNSAVNGFLTALLSTMIGYPAALYMAFHVASERARFILYLLVILPWWASYLVKVYAWKTILGTKGLLNTGLISLGAISEPMSVLLYSRFSVILTLTYIFTPFAILSIYAQLERIPTTLIEAARDLGATDGEIFRRITLPLSVPGMIAGGVITFSLGFGDFVAPTLVGGADSVMINNVVINLLGVSMDRPLGSAIGVVIVALAVVLLSVAHAAEKRTQVRL